MDNRQSVLITGGSGRIGKFIVNNLKDYYKVVVYDTKKPKQSDVDFIEGDLRDLDKFRQVTKNIDNIIHLAAYFTDRVMPSYSEGWDVNSTGTFNVFESAVRNNVKKVVYASSICATGIATWVTSDHGLEYFPVDEKHHCRPENLYGVTKLLAEKLAWMYAIRSETIFIGFRIATVYFKSMEDGIDESTSSIVNKFIKDPTIFLNLEPLPDEKRSTYKIADPRSAEKDLTWQYIDARDLAQAFKLALLKNNIKYEIYNIGAADTPTSWESLKLAKYFYPEVPILDPSSFLIDKKKPLWDIKKAQQELDYKPQHSWKEYL
ncbi:MAG: NAD(P)-dependent oxidoreductase [Bacteroidales bacterium]|jgi:nucleoside-diphosphate-sugar epimerase|nr:NAD(P)-dependent oxidoreductase [Actinomycetota bacterium]MDX9797326.1 NAD(P)-dependent oxidoreductase [Bacteroidales bacterium]